MGIEAGACGVDDVDGGMLRRRLRVAAAAACMLESGLRAGGVALAVVVGGGEGWRNEM